MKAILAATDFSKASGNAVSYAAQLAKLSNSKLILLHVYSIPIVADVPVVLPVWDDLEQDFTKALERQRIALIHKHGTDFPIECVCRMGYSVEEIVNQISKDLNVDLVVMGMRGADYLTEKLIGSETTKLIKKSDCPVLVINEKVKFKKLKSIVLAYDYEKKINKNVLNPLKEFAQLFNSKVMVLNVVNEKEKYSRVGVGVEHFIQNLNHTYHTIKNEDVISGLDTFIKDNKADMIVIISRKHTFLRTIFRESNTKKMAFHTSIPLLALHE